MPGGGCALLRASQELMILTNGGHQSADVGIGAVIVKAACQEPIRQMAQNAGSSPDLIISQVLDSDYEFGWDFLADDMTNLLRDGIIDPTKVTRTALQNAASCAGTLITTNFGIIQTEDK